MRSVRAADGRARTARWLVPDLRLEAPVGDAVDAQQDEVLERVREAWIAAVANLLEDAG